MASSEEQETTDRRGPDDIERWRAISSHNLARFWEYPVRVAGQRWAQWDDVWAADADSPCSYLNSATLRRPVASGDPGALVERLRSFYGEGHEGPWMLWSAWPSSVDLTRYGLQLVGHPPLMVRPAGGSLPPTPPELDIVEVADDAALRVFETVFVDGYPIPELQLAGSRRMFDPRMLGGPLRLWVGSVGEEPISVAASYRGEQAVSVYMVATLPHARGKGYGAALTAQACQVATGLPVELQASDDGRPVYLRLGFQIITPYDLWIVPR